MAAVCCSCFKPKQTECNDKLRSTTGEEVLRWQGRALAVDELIADIAQAEQKLTRNGALSPQARPVPTPTVGLASGPYATDSPDADAPRTSENPCSRLHSLPNETRLPRAVVRRVAAATTRAPESGRPGAHGTSGALG